MNNIKSMWNVINQKIVKNSKKKNNINYIIENNKKIPDSKEIAEHFNKSFCNIGNNLSDKIRPPINEEIIKNQAKPGIDIEKRTVSSFA